MAKQATLFTFFSKSSTPNKPKREETTPNKVKLKGNGELAPKLAIGGNVGRENRSFTAIF